MTENVKLKSFDEKNLPLIVDVVVPLWSPSAGDSTFKRFNVEYIVRNNIFENDFCFELVDSENNFLAAAFFAGKGDVSKADLWFEEESKRFPDELKKVSGMSRTYIKMMDERTLSLMNDDDIKLSLFVSRKKGFGSKLLNIITEKLKADGWKNLYLWTDCECNWKWYSENGFTLVQEDVYELFSSPDEDYKTYIFRKAL